MTRERVPIVAREPTGVGLTLPEYADAKRLPEHFLQELGLRDVGLPGGVTAVRIPYYDVTHLEVAVRYRLALDGPDRFRWRRGTKLSPYGLWRLDRARLAEYVIIVEGESDCQTLWYHDRPALGLPGAGTWRDGWARYFDGIPTIYVVLEPGGGGDVMLQWISRSEIRNRVRLVRLGEFKDPSALYLANPHLFAERLDAYLGAATPPAPSDEDDHAPADLPVISVTDRRLTAKTRDALRALDRANLPAPRVFQQGGILVRLRRDEDGAPRVDALTTDSMRGELDRVALWMRDGKMLPVPTDPPTGVVRDVLSQPAYTLPPLRAIAETPFFSAEARLIVEPGYHADTGMFLHGAPGLVIPTVPSEPSAEDVHRAKALLLDELLVDFPFIDQASRAHAVGLLLLPFVRELIRGATPNHAIDAPTAGTGKGLLVEAISLVSTGRTIEVATESTNDEEIRKRLTALFLSGAPFALVDNATHRIESPILAAALTATRWTDRILGASRMVSLAVRTTFVVTGNNLAFSREHLRRAVWVRLDASAERPYLRTGFRHHPLGPWVVAHRADLIWAALVLVQNWVAEGQSRFTARVLGSYEAWAEVIGGILGAAGINGFLENLDVFAKRANAETDEWGRFVRAWHELHANHTVSADQLYPLAAVYLPDVLGDKGERSQRTRLGLALRKRTDSIIADHRIVAIENFRDALGRLRPAWSLRDVPCAREPVPRRGGGGDDGGGSVPNVWNVWERLDPAKNQDFQTSQTFSDVSDPEPQRTSLPPPRPTRTPISKDETCEKRSSHDHVVDGPIAQLITRVCGYDDVQPGELLPLHRQAFGLPLRIVAHVEPPADGVITWTLAELRDLDVSRPDDGDAFETFLRETKSRKNGHHPMVSQWVLPGPPLPGPRARP
jgi:hypothetical protein